MGGRISWYRPRTRRQREKAAIIPATVPVLLLFIGLLMVIGLKWLVAAECSDSACCNPLPEGNRVENIFKKALAEVLPGLESPPVLEKQEIYHFTMDSCYALTGFDIRDPRTVLNFELGAGSLVSVPAISPSPTVSVSGEKEAPQPHSSLPPVPALGRNGDSFTVRPGTQPVILIYHTHITESFLPSSQVSFTENMDLSVCLLGKELAKLLREQYGLPVIHHQGIFDQPRRFAYEKARPVIQELLKDNEQIRLVLDLHRDGVARSSTTVDLGNGPLGRILFVIGSQHAGVSTNLQITRRLQQELESLIPGLSRGILQKNFVYNQDLHPYATLIEMGGHENSMEEAMKAVPYLAEAVARAYVSLFKTTEE